MPDFDTNDNSNPQQTAQGPQDAQSPASAVPSNVNVPAPPTPVSTEPKPAEDHNTILGKAVSGLRHAIEGRQVVGYEPDENGVLQEKTGPRKPGQIFRDILLGAMIGGAAGSETPNRESALGGFAMGGATAVQNQDARYAAQAAKMKQQAQQDQAGQQRNQQRIMQEAQVAHNTINLLDFDSHSNRYAPTQIDAHNASNDVMKKQLLANGGRVPTILVNGQNLNDGKANNGYALMQQFNKDPQSVMQAPEGFHRLPVTSIDTSGLKFNDGKWYDSDGNPADLEKYTTHTLVDIPDQAFGQRVQLTGQQINDLMGYQQIPANQSKKLFTTSIASVMGLNTKSIKNLNDARRDLYAAPKNDAEYQQMQARYSDIQQRIADDPSSVTDEEKHFVQAKGGVLTAFQQAQNADAANKRANAVQDISAKAPAEASAEAQKEVAKQNTPGGQLELQGKRLTNQKTATDIAKTQQEIADAKTGATNRGTDIFGASLGGPGVDNKEYNRRYDSFGKTYIQPLTKLEKTDSEFSRILSSKNMTGAQKVTALLSAVGISGDPLKGAGFRISQQIIDEHAGSRNIWEAAVQRANQIIGSGGPITEKQVRDYANIARDVVHDARVSAANEAHRQGLPVDFLPKGHGKTIDPDTAKLYYDAAGGDKEAARKAAQASGWVF
jgi:hypothetical protein